MTVLVSDVSVLIDLEHGSLLSKGSSRSDVQERWFGLIGQILAGFKV